MEEKLRILMQSENLTASKLAEILEVKPAAISHILSGRNKPSFELLCKIVNRFPQINPYWLLGDATEMSNANTPKSTSPGATPLSRSLFDVAEEKEEKSANSNIPFFGNDVPIPTSGNSDIEKIVIIYKDQTFEVLRQKKNIG